MMLPGSISPELRAYLADWLAWTERGAPEGKPYSRRYGVRGEIYLYPGKRLFREMDSLFREQFAASYLFPFGGQRRFTDDYMNSTMHENPERLAWVRMMLGTYDEVGRRSFNRHSLGWVPK